MQNASLASSGQTRACGERILQLNGTMLGYFRFHSEKIVRLEKNILPVDVRVI
jgi:hypothetical protein